MADESREYTPQPKAHLSRAFYATKPTRATLFWRTFLPWQMWRFAVINLKMLTILRRSHGAHTRGNA